MSVIAQPKFEYLRIRVAPGIKDDLDHLNTLGDLGWELVSSLFNTSTELIIHYMKRKILQ